MLILIFIVTQSLTFIRGGKGMKSWFGFKLCGLGYWLTLALMPAIVAVISYFTYNYLKAEYARKVSLSYKFDRYDIKFDMGNFIKIMIGGFLAGMLSGALGVGGGLCLVTVLLSLKFQSRVAGATTGLNNLWIGITSIIFVFVNNVILWSETLFYTGLAVFGGLVISKFIYYIVQKYKKHSIIIFIVFCLAILNFVSTVAYIFQDAYEQGWAHLVEFSNTLCKE